MSKLGETADGILEALSKEEKLNVNELEKKVPLVVLNFMEEEGLIKLEKEDVSITKFGSELLTAGQLP